MASIGFTRFYCLVVLLSSLPHTRAMRLEHKQLATKLGKAHWTPSFGSMGTSPSELANQGVERACMDDLAEIQESMLKADAPELLPKLSVTCPESKEEELLPLECENLVGAVYRRWAMEDAIHAATSEVEQHQFEEQLAVIKKNIKNRLFSVTHARQMCVNQLFTKPRADSVRQCMMEKVDLGKTYRRRSWYSKSEQQLDLSTEQKKTLKALIEKRWKQEQELQVLTNTVDHVPSEKSELKDSLTDLKTSELEYTKQQIKLMEFSYFHTLRECEEEKKDDTFHNSALVIGRIKAEFGEAVHEEVQQCVEDVGEFCPEGSIASMSKEFDKLGFASAYGASVAVYKPAATTIGFIVGSMIGGPTLGYTFYAAAAIPGPCFVVTLPIAYAASQDWFPKCRCTKSECIYDEQLKACTMESGNSSNPFHKLPYPGQRCVLTGSDENGKEKCELEACRSEDFSKRSSGSSVFGTVGIQLGTRDTHNCLSTTGTFDGSLLTVGKFSIGGKPVSNDQYNRIALYSEAGVTF